MFQKILIANRGEIACRIARTVRRLGIRSVAVYSDADQEALHVAECDEAVRIGPSAVRESYLHIPALVAAIQSSGADAVHPGYGLLSENAEFARAVARANATFIGPAPEALEQLGDKLQARALARSQGALPPPGSAEPIDPVNVAQLFLVAEQIGFPILIKAAAGGGGIGMLRVLRREELERSARACADRARQAFGDGRVYLERYLERPRHIEVQVVVDSLGNALTLGERECSVQRRHQKVIEEAPSPAGFLAGAAGRAVREALFQQALSVVRAAGYRGAGTVEFLVDASGAAFFLEVNARLQVEHAVTELVTGLDLVEIQIDIAQGRPLADGVSQAAPRGHALEARLYAEDPARGYLPQPGRLERLRFPELEGVRIDSGVREGSEVTTFYDPLLAKVIAHGQHREQAIQRLDQALESIEVSLMGPKGPRVTNREMLRRVLAHPEFRSGDYDTHLVERLGDGA